jgi:hypothetical protein
MTVDEFKHRLGEVLSVDGVRQAHVDRIDLVAQSGARITIVDGTFQAQNKTTKRAIEAAHGITGEPT